MELVIRKLWNSPTIATWMSYSTKAISLFVVLPLILKRFTEGEVALWYLFSTIISLQGLLDMGFRNTFIRLFSYALGGLTDITSTFQTKVLTKKSEEPNWDLLGKIYANMVHIYGWLTILVIIVMGTLGSWSMLRPISFVKDSQSAWLAWGCIIIASAYKFYGSIYSNYLEGLNKIALVRRWEALTSAASITSCVIALAVNDSLLLLVFINQLWVILSVVRNYFLSRAVDDKQFEKIKTDYSFDRKIFAAIWPVAWRSGLSGFMSNGLNNLSSVLYAQIGNSASVASYLLALRIIAQIKEISMAPFYSKIPLYARLRVQGDLNQLIQKAQRGMFLSHLVFALGVIAVGITSNYLLIYINSDIKFVSNELWLLLSVAYFIHRYGAMHMQLYLTTNHVIGHIADGISGVIFVAVTLLLINTYQIYAIPIGMIAGYLGFYAWYSAYYSYKSIHISAFKFEYKVSLVPFMLLIIYSATQLI
ncbi:polysaccharide biosynthesis protein [Spirosoma aerophilum]